jgi:hypothetical protein
VVDLRIGRGKDFRHNGEEAKGKCLATLSCIQIIIISAFRRVVRVVNDK